MAITSICGSEFYGLIMNCVKKYFTVSITSYQSASLDGLGF